MLCLVIRKIDALNSRNFWIRNLVKFPKISGIHVDTRFNTVLIFLFFNHLTIIYALLYRILDFLLIIRFIVFWYFYPIRKQRIKLMSKAVPNLTFLLSWLLILTLWLALSSIVIIFGKNRIFSVFGRRKMGNMSLIILYIVISSILMGKWSTILL